MRQFLASDMPGLNLVGEFLQETENAKERMMKADLTTQQGRDAALACQAEARAFDRAIHLIVDIANQGEE